MAAGGTNELVSVRARGVGMGLGAALFVLWLPRPASLDPAAWQVAALGVLMATWWVLDVLPRAVTAMLPLLVLPVLGIQPMAVVSAAYAHPLLYLMLGGFVVGHAMESVGLHARLTAWLLRPTWVRLGPGRVVAALMAATALFSGLVSNTATVLMMLPLAVSMSRVVKEDGSAAGGFVLALAYAASIGGMTTLVGTPPNAVLAGMAPGLIGVEVGFAQWMLVGVPAALMLLPVAWWSVVRFTYRLPVRFATPVAAPPMPVAHAGEPWVLAVASTAMLLWLTRADKVLGAVTLPGWENLLPTSGSELDAVVAVGAAVVLFLVPGARDPEGRRRSLLTWQGVQQAVPWSVLLLLGGGFALAGAIKATGLTEWIAGAAGGLADLPSFAKVFVVCLGMTFVTELTSNTATAQIAIPVLAQAAPNVGLAPMLWLVPATLSASCAFMMPVATAPNAIASEAAGVTGSEMAKAGLVVNLVGAVLLTILAVAWVPVVFPG